MRKLPDVLADLALVLWIGGMWVVGYVVVPILFKVIPDRMQAGYVAGHLFSATAWIGMACALYLAAYQLFRDSKAALRSSRLILLISVLVLVLIGQFYLQPLIADLKTQAQPLDVMNSPFADQFKMWHGVSSIVYLIQSLLGALLVVRWRQA